MIRVSARFCIRKSFERRRYRLRSASTNASHVDALGEDEHSSNETSSQTRKTETLTQLEAATLPSIRTGVDCIVKTKPLEAGRSRVIALSAVEAAAKYRTENASTSTSRPQNDISCLILTPTRDAVKKTSKETTKIAKLHSNITVQTAIKRGPPIKKSNVDVLVSNLERVLVLLRYWDESHVDFPDRLRNLQLLCIDQADKMESRARRQLLPYLKSAMNHGKRQTLVFTENLDDESVNEFAQSIIRNDCQCIDTVKAEKEQVCSHVRHELRPVRTKCLIGTLVAILSNAIQCNKDNNTNDKILVFLENTMLAQFVAKIVAKIGLKKDNNDHTECDTEFVQMHAMMNLVERNVAAKRFEKATSSVILFCTNDTVTTVNFHPQPTLIVHLGLVDREEYMNRLVWSVGGSSNNSIHAPKSILLLDLFEVEYMENELADMELVKINKEESEAEAIVDKVKTLVSQDYQLCTSAELSYRNWLRYYSERRESLGLCKTKLVDRARRFSKVVLGLKVPPPLRNKVVESLDLIGVPGIIMGRPGAVRSSKNNGGSRW